MNFTPRVEVDFECYVVRVVCVLCLGVIISYLGRMFVFWFYYLELVGWMCCFFFVVMFASCVS